MVKQEMSNVLEKKYLEGGWKEKPELTKDFFTEVFGTINDMADTSIIPEAGACVSIVVVREEEGNKVCYTANAGDSSIYILDKEKEDSEKVSYDHHT